LRKSAESVRGVFWDNSATASTMIMPENQQPQRRWQFRFGIAEIMMITLIFCVMAAAGNYLRSSIENGSGRAVFSIFTLVSPMALILVLSAYTALRRWVKNLRS